jgi:uncharacterized membrane protein YesL
MCGPLVFLFPLMVSYPAPWRRIIRNAVLFGGCYLRITVLGILALAIAGLGTAFAPAALPAIAAGTAYVLSRSTRLAFANFLARGAPGVTHQQSVSGR